MRNVFYIMFLIIIYGRFLNYWFATDYNEKIKITSNPKEANTKLNIKWAKLIENYVVKLEGNLKDFEEKYKIKNNLKIRKYKREIKSMYTALRKIQTTNIEKSIAEDVTNTIIRDLKDLNRDIKNLLRSKKDSLEKENLAKQKRLFLLWIKLSSALDKIILRILRPLSTKKILSLREDKIISHLKVLKSQSNKLKNLKNGNFENEHELKISILRILKNIKRETIQLKDLLN